MSPSGSPLTASVLAIGDEVLRGEIVNGNAAYLSAHLFDLGFALGEHTVVSDEPGEIRGALRRLGALSDVLLVTGGLGPTEDDRTVDVVSDLLGVEPEVHPPSLEQMKARFARHDYQLTPNNMRQVRVPRGALALFNAAGMAPGFSTQLGRATAFFMPGVPREMSRIFEDHVIALLRSQLNEAGAPPTASRTWHVYGMGESHVDHRLAGLLDGVPDATLHYRTAQTENHVKVVLRGRTPEQAAALPATLDRLDHEVRERLGHAVYGVDDDTFPLAVQRVFREKGATLAFAESCTGGQAGQLVTTEPGASAFFLGSIVTYSNEAKMALLNVQRSTLDAHGAVSEPCARQMAEGARRALMATIAVSITGVAGDTRDKAGAPSPQQAAPGVNLGGKPVGTVCFGVATPGAVRTETKLMFGSRERIRLAASYYALSLARRSLIEDEG